jgi:thymidylate kinase
LVKNVFVLLLGFPGVGKLTIANALASHLGAKVIDNHWINNPILALLRDDGHATLPEGVREQRTKVRMAVLETVASLCDPMENFILTHADIDGDKRSNVSYEAMQQTADRRRALFVPVRLQCEESELIYRITSESRRERFKSIDADAARQRSRNANVFNPQHGNCLTVDVTDMDADEVAHRIFAHINHLLSGNNCSSRET